ncbi:MAG: SIR2 family protein [Deferribacterales bacterium]
MGKVSKKLIEHLNKIKYAIDNNQLILFVGAGVSKNSGIPDWNELTLKLAEELNYSKRAELQESYIAAKLESYDPSLLENYNKLQGFDPDEYLKIPQYYYLNFGKKKYNEKLQSVLDIKCEPNAINHIIFELNPQHIITTNYDDLIEKAMDIEKENFSVITTDKELAKAENKKLLIKMHGDFKNNVLKESDYDTYSENFTLVETFIKGLLVTHTLLFIGFSADDPNVRKIFRWIKNILGKEYNSAYLLDVSSQKDMSASRRKILNKYLSSFGINCVYHYQFANMYSTFNIDEQVKLYYDRNTSLGQLEHDKGRKLFDSLIFLREYNQNSTYSNYSLFNIISYNFLGLSISAVKELENESINTEGSLQGQYIAKLITGNQKIQTFIKDNDYIYNSHLSDLLMFNYAAIKNSLNGLEDELSNSCNINSFEKTYLLYKNCDYLEAYEEQKTLSNNAYKSNNYLAYCLSEFQRKLLSIVINIEYFPHDAQVESIVAEGSNIDLDFLSDKFVHKDNKDVFKKLFNFEYVNNIHSKLSKTLDEIHKTKEYFNRGGSATNSALADLYSSFFEIWNFCNHNFLILDYFNEIRECAAKFIEGLIVSYTIDDKNVNTLNQLYFPADKLNYFDYFHFYVMIEYVDKKGLESLFWKHLEKVDILKTSSGVIDQLIEGYCNLIDSAIKHHVVNRLDHKISNFLLIFAKLELSSDQLEKILLKYSELTKCNLSSSIHAINFRNNKYEILTNFLFRTYNNLLSNKAYLSTIYITGLIDEIIDNIKFWQFPYYQASKVIQLFKIISLINKKNSIDNEFLLDNAIYSKICQINDLEIRNNVFIVFFNLFSHENQKEIRKILLTTIDNLTQDYDYLSFIYELITTDIIDISLVVEKRTLQILNGAIKDRRKSFQGISSKDLLRLSLTVIVDFLITDKWIGVDILRAQLPDLKKLQNDYDAFTETHHDKHYLDYLNELTECIRIIEVYVSIDNFDFDSFVPSDIQYYSDELIDKIRVLINTDVNLKKILVQKFRDRDFMKLVADKKRIQDKFYRLLIA